MIQNSDAKWTYQWTRMTSPIGDMSQGLAAPPYGVAGPWPPLRLLFGLLEASVNIRRFGFCFVQFQEYFCVTFLKHKNSRKQGLALWHLVNRLVLKNT
jgi:hypothetical protein